MLRDTGVLTRPKRCIQNFEIYVANELPAQDVSISIRIDGTFIGRYFLTGQGKNVLPGLYVSDSVTKPFCFRELKIPGRFCSAYTSLLKLPTDNGAQMSKHFTTLALSNGRTWASWNSVYTDAYARVATSFAHKMFPRRPRTPPQDLHRV